MNETKHTPTPGSGEATCRCEIKLMGQGYTPPLIERKCPLCASAPELLAAAKIVEDILASRPEKDNLKHLADILADAISKAEGRAKP